MKVFKNAREHLDYVDSFFIKGDGYLDTEAKAKWIKEQLKELRMSKGKLD